MVPYYVAKVIDPNATMVFIESKETGQKVWFIKMHGLLSQNHAKHDH